MKILITAQEPDPQAKVDPRFGRAKCFIVFDTETQAYQPVDNVQNLNAAQGAGIQAGKLAAQCGAKVVLTGHVGPKAFATLRAAGILVCTGAGPTVADAVRQFQDGQLQANQDADVEGHWV